MMEFLGRFISLAVLVLLLLLTAIAGYAYSEVSRLSLPISQLYALFAVLLPIVTGLSLQSTYSLLRIHIKNLGRTRPTLYIMLILGAQLIYETVIATLALTYMIPSSTLNCGLEEQWKQLFRNKDGTAIRRIQDRFDCCGFNSVWDRAWPFPEKGVSAKACQERFDRTQSCVGQWRQAEQINAGLFLMIAAIIFVTKLIAVIAFFATSNSSTTVPWLLASPVGRVAAINGDSGRRLIDEGEPQEQYHDEDGSEAAGNTEVVTSDANANGNRPRIEPSGLLNTGDGWREGH